MFCKKWQHVRGQQLFHPSVLPRHVDRRSSRLLSHYRVRELVGGGGGGLNCEAKAQVLIVTPPLFFQEVGRKKGERNSGAVRYINIIMMTHSGLMVKRKLRRSPLGSSSTINISCQDK